VLWFGSGADPHRGEEFSLNGGDGFPLGPAGATARLAGSPAFTRNDRQIQSAVLGELERLAPFQAAVSRETTSPDGWASMCSPRLNAASKRRHYDPIELFHPGELVQIRFTRRAASATRKPLTGRSQMPEPWIESPSQEHPKSRACVRRRTPDRKWLQVHGVHKARPQDGSRLSADSPADRCRVTPLPRPPGFVVAVGTDPGGTAQRRQASALRSGFATHASRFADNDQLTVRQGSARRAGALPGPVSWEVGRRARSRIGREQACR
jgi:hypothetical protein